MEEGITQVVRRLENYELVDMSVEELKEYAAAINDLTQIKKIRLVLKCKLEVLKALDEGSY